MAFGKLLPIITEQQRVVMIDRRGPPHQALDEHMIRRLVDEIRPAHNMGDVLDHIIMGDRDMVTRVDIFTGCLLYTSPSPRDKRQSRMPSSA